MFFSIKSAIGIWRKSSRNLCLYLPVAKENSCLSLKLPQVPKLLPFPCLTEPTWLQVSKCEDCLFPHLSVLFLFVNTSYRGCRWCIGICDEKLGKHLQILCFSCTRDPPTAVPSSRRLAHLESLLRRGVFWKSMWICLLLLVLSVHKLVKVK